MYSNDGQGNDGQSMILNKNLKKMKQKIRQIMVIKRCLYETKIKKPPRPMHEVVEECNRIRQRLAQMQQKQLQKQLEKKKMIENAGCSYGFGDKQLQFPFLTMTNDYYAVFMTHIMKNL